MTVSSANWVLGLSLALLSCFLSSLGLTFQRLSVLRELALKEQRLHDGAAAGSSREVQHLTPEQTDRRWIRQPLWLLGVVLYISASVPDVMSYVLVPQVVCSAVACFKLVVVTIMASSLLGEKVSRWQVLGMLACTIGTLTCVCFGPVRMQKAAMVRHWSQPQVAIYLIAGASVLLVLFVFDHLDSISVKCVFSARFRSFTLPLVTGLTFAISKVFNTEIGFVSLPNNLLEEPKWMCMAIAIALLGLFDLYLNLRATRLMAVHVFVPVAFVWAITLQFFQSVALFSEFNGLSIAQVTLSIAGACLSLVGAIGLQIPPKSEGAEDKSDLDVRAPSQLGLDMQDCKGVTLLDC